MSADDSHEGELCVVSAVKCTSFTAQTSRDGEAVGPRASSYVTRRFLTSSSLSFSACPAVELTIFAHSAGARRMQNAKHQTEDCVARKGALSAGIFLCSWLIYAGMHRTWREAPESAEMRLSEEGS